MRILALIPLLTLVGCATMREAAGKYSELAEKGVEVKVGDDAPAAQSPASTAPLPGGLAGDGKARTYAEPIPRSS